MKDHPDRTARLQVMGRLFAGQSWQTAVSQSQWMVDLCTQNPQIASSHVQSELQSRFGVAVSVSQINRVRAKLGVTKQGRGRALAHGEKN